MNPWVLTLGFQKINHAERNHTEGELLVHLIPYCKGTCPPFILLAKQPLHEPHEDFFNEFFSNYIQQYIQLYFATTGKCWHYAQQRKLPQ